MEFLLGLLTGLAIGFLWGVWRATQSFIERIIERPEEIKEIMDRVKRVNDEYEKEITQVDNSKLQAQQDIKAEFHDGVCYLYDQNDKFLAQGSTVTEAMDRAEQRFPGMKLKFRVNLPEQSNQ